MPWYQAMGAHCLIHAGFVGVITQNIYLGIAEFILHFFVDIGKCRGEYTYNQDQFLHMQLKFIYMYFVT